MRTLAPDSNNDTAVNIQAHQYPCHTSGSTVVLGIPLQGSSTKGASLPWLNGRTRENFAALARWWHRDTDGLSVVTRILLHPAYTRVIAMGKPAIPLILEDLRDHGGFWYTALEAITGQVLGSAEERRKPRLMTQVWLDWGRANGHAG